MIFNYLDQASYNQTMELFRVWLNKHGIDISDREVRSEVEDLAEGIFDSFSLSESVRKDMEDDIREEYGG